MNPPAQTLQLSDSPSGKSIGQALLFSPEIEQLVVAGEHEGVYTADRLREKDPGRYAAIVELSGRDWGQLRIARLLKVHHRTVAAVQLAEPEQIDIGRSKMVSALRQAAWLQLERLLEHPETVPMNVSGLILSQLLDKAELLDGRATSRVEHTERVNIFDDWQSFLEKHLEPEKVREIHSGGGNPPTIGSGASGGSADRDGAGEGQRCAAEPSSDALSLASGTSTQEQSQTDTDGDTDRETEPADRSLSGTGGEGVQDQGRGGQDLNSSRRSENF